MNQNSLHGIITPQDLRALLEQTYYKAIIEQRTRMSKEQADARLLNLMQDIRLIEKSYVAKEKYALAIVCRDTNNELLEMHDFNISLRNIEPC